ncbi:MULTISPECIES: autotransporter outer membrane beta-barrel domain-containing protein [unclassified Rhodanobacter]|uniref:autotransporter outer membrane beta-barrel domain-containing protein n=1 Tax=unclassified Rhodanobacter TaxID=2621553 RepID=UPI001BDE2D83|nr:MULTISPECIES: autotransporter outer membrane beta-barrel domain-containing protein [unclassified Rhodanobacter]MBT2142586.1 autotransporter outer membrane beta-barrel domain-containing protein [Rhodanobacter sp. LX-99]MBT2148341.1 autotransporter outer membrane beta-barrel domain-containing protein [Rhodanobacter sp. LX-100]
MSRKSWRSRCSTGCAGLLLLGGVASAQDPPSPEALPPTGSGELSAVIRQSMREQDARIAAMRAELAAQNAQIEAMKRELASQQADYRALRRAVGLDTLEQQRAGNVRAGGPGASALPMPVGEVSAEAVPSRQTPDRPVGQAPERDERPPAVAPIFNQPGVLTPRGKLVVEPSYQFGYSSADRVALIGYTVIPAILIGLIDARQVKTTTQTGAVALRYGLSNRLEMELRVPYVYGHTDTISREIFTGSATDKVFTSSGHGIGDIEATARYQLNDGGADRPYYVGWLRFKSRTGRDPFEVTTDCVNRCVQNATGTGLPLQLPTGSGFYSLQPGVTWLYPSDPVVFFGNLSYLHNFPRHNVSRTVLLGGKEPLGTVRVGDIADVSIGMGLALNDKASISIGYDQSFIGITKQNGKTAPGSAKSVLGTLLIGGSYRFSDKRSMNFTLGVGVTRDTPDATVTVRVPMMY